MQKNLTDEEKLELAAGLHKSLIKKIHNSEDDPLASWNGLIFDLFKHGMQHSNSDDLDIKYLAGFKAVENFLNKLEKWAEEAVKRTNSFTPGMYDQNARLDYVRRHTTFPQLNGYEYDYVVKHYPTGDKSHGIKRSESDMLRLKDAKLGRRNMLVGSAGIAATSTAAIYASVKHLKSLQQSRPPIHPLQKEEEDAVARFLQAEARQRNFYNAREEMGQAFEEYKAAKAKRIEGGQQRYADDVEAWQQEHGPNYMDYLAVFASGGLFAAGLVGLTFGWAHANTEYERAEKLVQPDIHLKLSNIGMRLVKDGIEPVLREIAGQRRDKSPE